MSGCSFKNCLTTFSGGFVIATGGSLGSSGGIHPLGFAGSGGGWVGIEKTDCGD